ncbi:DUF2946 family protein [Phreatobacter sp.]|uniref:DUF2946 family protein n=1 Tax=Phreatobacter sp. TaxID=1966341 RepID=UPI003F6EBA0F
MDFLRGDRFRLARNVIVATLAYVVAATGLLGGVMRSAHGLDAGGGMVVICTIDGMVTVPADSEPARKAQPAIHCVLCHVIADVALPAPDGSAMPVEPPVVVRAPARSYDPVLPARASDGWRGTRSPRAPPFSA